MQAVQVGHPLPVGIRNVLDIGFFYILEYLHICTEGPESKHNIYVSHAPYLHDWKVILHSIFNNFVHETQLVTLFL